jgi:hypothetical protein
MSLTPVYERNLENSLCHFDGIELIEYDNSFNDSGYIYSGITLLLDFTGFTSYFDTIEHAYFNIILNNDVYAYTGLTGETHYFEIYDFYSGATPYIDPLLTGFTEDEIISGFTKNIIECTSKLINSDNCCPVEVSKSNLPWIYQTNHGSGFDNCSPFIQRRPERGFMLDYVFNRNGLPWADSVFFYEGVRDEYDQVNYLDNNLSFAFTSDGRIKWTSYRYTGYCDTVSGYTDSYYISTGQTLPLCTNGTSDNFNITITFERYYEYSGCSLANEGGWNDLIHTGETSTDGSVIIVDTQIEKLSNLWIKERNSRLGILKIYLNGRPQEIEVPLSPIKNFRNLPVYHWRDWEEIILSDRGNQPFTHAVGGGVTGSGNLHNSVCCYSIKYAAYFENYMDALDIRNRYLTVTDPTYNITECWDLCTDTLIGEFLTPTPSFTPSITPSSITPSIMPSNTPIPSITPTVTPT